MKRIAPLSLLLLVFTFCIPLSAEELWIQNGNRRLYGVLSRPNSAEKRQPVVIIAHGFNGTHHSGLAYSEPLNRLGYQVYAFDFACGSTNSRSDNNTMNMSIRDEESDLLAVVRHFRQQTDVDPRRIIVIGESQGGLVAALTAAEHPKEISRLILVYPAFCIPDNWNAQYPQLENVPDTTRLWNVPLGRRFFQEIRQLPSMKYIGKYRRPVLIIHGDADPIVPVDYSRQALQLYKKAKLHIIPNAGHGFRPKEFEESLKEIRQFLQE